MLRLFFFIVALFAFMLFLEAWRIINAPADYSRDSPWGDYKVESVWIFTPLLPSFNLGYMRFVRKDSGAAYRSPFFNQDALEMGVYESQESIGMTSMTFSKIDHRIELHMNGWCPVWLNYLVSNVDYSSTGDGGCEILKSD